MRAAQPHIELTTSDLGKAKKFYKKVFDWKLTDMPMGDSGGVYTMIAPGKGPGGGMQAKPMPDAPVTWPGQAADEASSLKLRLRLPLSERVVAVRVNGKPRPFDPKTATVDLSGLRGTLYVEAALA